MIAVLPLLQFKLGRSHLSKYLLFWGKLTFHALFQFDR